LTSNKKISSSVDFKLLWFNSLLV